MHFVGDGKAPSLEGVPFIGEAQKKLAGAPRPISEDRSTDRNRFEPGRSLAADMPAGMLDSDQEASASDSGSPDLATEPSSDDGSASLDAKPSIEGDVAADAVEKPAEDMIDLPAIPDATEVKPSADDVKPATALEPAIESTTSGKTKVTPSSTEPMIELPTIPETEEVAPNRQSRHPRNLSR